MPEVHLVQWTAAFLAATWLTARWILDRPGQRWRHIVGGLTSTLLWIPVAYTANNVYVADGGASVGFGSEALGYVAIFMVVVSIIGLLVGLLLWVEDEADTASSDLPPQMRPGRRG
ncbi:MAG: hypothetical protein ACOCQY_02705 [Halorhabdus sp.]